MIKDGVCKAMPRIAYVQVDWGQEMQDLMLVGEDGHLAGETLCGKELPGPGWVIRGWAYGRGSLRDDVCRECKERREIMKQIPYFAPYFREKEDEHVEMRVVQET